MQPFEHSKTWQACHLLVLEIYKTTASFPREERFGLTSQIRRAAVSVVANIVEGGAKTGARELRRFVDISRGSLAEVVYFLRLSLELGYLTKPEYDRLLELHSHAGRLTFGLHSWAKRQAQKGKE